METSTLLASILGPIYLVFGFSLLIHQKSWQQLIEKYAKDHFQLFPLALFDLFLGLFLVRLHNVWDWNLNLLITISGWAIFLKGVFYFLAPDNWILPVLKLKKSKEMMAFGGVVALLMGVALLFALIV